MGITQYPVPYAQYQIVQLTSGTTWTVPSNVTTIDVFMVGGGQGGPGRSTSATANNTPTVSGGAGGAIIYQEGYPVTPGQVITYSIGAGGSAGANPAPTASITNHGGGGGNTIFDALVAPGAANKTGNKYGYTSPVTNYYRGAYDVNQNNDQAPSGNLTSSTHYSFAGMPGDINSQIVAVWASSASAASHFTTLPAWNNDSNRLVNRDGNGISPTFSKMLALASAPTGSNAGGNDLVASVKLPGWGGYGGYAQSGATGTGTYPTWHGAGQGASINTSTTGVTKQYSGGAAAPNSGAGGGGAAVTNGSAVVVGTPGAAGGSGVIIVGFFA